MTGMTRWPSGHRLDDQDPVPPLTASYRLPRWAQQPDGCRHVDGQDRGSAPRLAVYDRGGCTTEMESLPRAGQLAGSNNPFRTRTNEVGDLQLSGLAHSRQSPEQHRQSGRDRLYELYEIGCQASGGIETVQGLGDLLPAVGLIDISQQRENPLSQLFIDGSSHFRTPPRLSPTHLGAALAPARSSSSVLHH